MEIIGRCADMSIYNVRKVYFYHHGIADVGVAFASVCFGIL